MLLCFLVILCETTTSSSFGASARLGSIAPKNLARARHLVAHIAGEAKKLIPNQDYWLEPEGGRTTLIIQTRCGEEPVFDLVDWERGTLDYQKTYDPVGLLGLKDYFLRSALRRLAPADTNGNYTYGVYGMALNNSLVFESYRIFKPSAMPYH